jgi:hypothetical protein
VTVVVGILLSVMAAVTAVAVIVIFVWAARKDGEYDRSYQRRLGIRRKTRIGL